jgi:2-iminobutanoate/2-iminopropanoate deaminase
MNSNQQDNKKPTPIFLSLIPNAPKAIGPYSVATIYDSVVYCSGQIGLDPETGKIVSSDFEEQTKQVLTNISAILEHLKIDTNDG